MCAKGRVRIECYNGDTYIPIDNAKVKITKNSDTNPEEVEILTDSSGRTIEVDLETPPLEYSQEPSDNIPYSLCDISVERDGFLPFVVKGCQVFPDRVALQQCNMEENTGELVTRLNRAIIISIQPNTLVGNFPPKIPEAETKPLPPPTSGVVLPEPVVPEFVIVHQGRPDDNTAPNYTVRYSDYIKNVASCEIFSTWPETTIRANLYCIISFTLNRIYTEWYRGKGKNFDITSSTAFDQAFNYGRNIYDNISRIVDEIFSTYIRRDGQEQPLFAQYCDGKNVSCPGWLTQWGSKYLGDQGRTPYEILTTFYGSNINLVRAKKVEGIPQSYPGYTLTVGSSGEPVRLAQKYLNRISNNYPLIPKVAEDGVYGPSTQEAVRVFQGVFNLPKTGNIDYATWYKISDVYVGVTKIAELRGSMRSSEENRVFFPPLMHDMYDDPRVPRVYY